MEIPKNSSIFQHLEYFHVLSSQTAMLTHPDFTQVSPVRQRTSTDSTLLLVDGAYLAHAQKHEQFDPILLIKTLYPAAASFYYKYSISTAPTPSRLVSCGIFPVVIDSHWNSTGRPKGLAPKMLPDLLLYGEDYDQVIVVTASSEFVPAVAALNQRAKTTVKVAAFSSCPVSSALTVSIDLCHYV
ncbi:MAG: NYN domain-containing protein [Nodosilinea sp.]